MNVSNLPIYYSKQNLTTLYVDLSNVYLLPSICLFGIVTSFVCILVSCKRDDATNAKSLDYIWLNSLIDFFFLIIESFLFIIRCGMLCPYGYSYVSKLYEVYVYLYAGYILITAQMLLNIQVSYERLQMFSGKLNVGKKQLSIFQVFGICTVISVIANALPYPISREVALLAVYKPDYNSSYFELLYKRAFRKEFESPAMQNFMTAVYVIKNLVVFFVLCVLSILVCVRFRTYLNSRKQLVKRFDLCKCLAVLNFYFFILILIF